MKRLARILLNATTILSLLLCLAFAGLWVLGHWRWDVLYGVQSGRAGAPSRFIHVISGGGGVAVFVGAHAPGEVPPGTPGQWHYLSGPDVGIAYASHMSPGGRRFHHRWARDANGSVVAGVVFPAWAAAAALALLPAGRLTLAIRRRRRKRDGHCKHCGYDLRATPERCPECGMVSAP